VNEAGILSADPLELLAEYPCFYVYPFSARETLQEPL